MQNLASITESANEPSMKFGENTENTIEFVNERAIKMPLLSKTESDNLCETPQHQKSCQFRRKTSGLEEKKKEFFKLHSEETLSKSEWSMAARFSRDSSKVSRLSKSCSIEEEECLDIYGKCYKFNSTGMLFWQPTAPIESIVLVKCF